MEPSVCHVVNASRDTQLVSDIIEIQKNHPALGDIGLLSWYSDGDYIPENNVNYHCIDEDRSQIAPKFNSIIDARNITKKYDIAHLHYNRSGTYVKIAAFDSPIVVTEHNNHNSFSRKARIANGASNFLADRVVCVSKSVKESFKQWERLAAMKTDVTVVENGVFTNRINAVANLDWSIYESFNIPKDSILIGSAGALIEQKDHETLIKAVDQLNEEIQYKVTLIISGGGPLQEHLKMKIHQANYPNNIHLLGHLPDRLQVLKMMSEVDIYTMPSKWEGFSVAALEAMAMNNKCVFSNIKSFTEPFDGYAYFHKVGSSKSLKSTLKKAINTDSELADRAQAYVLNKYTLEKTCEEYNTIYKNLV